MALEQSFIPGLHRDLRRSLTGRELHVSSAWDQLLQEVEFIPELLLSKSWRRVRAVALDVFFCFFAPRAVRHLAQSLRSQQH